MAFLTKYTLSKLSQKLSVKEEVSLESFLELIYDDKEIYFLLNKREIEYLFIYRMLLNDEKEFFLEYYKKVLEEPDTKTLVFNRGGKIKYHLYQECSMLSRDYLDFFIPPEIQNISKNNPSLNITEEYRYWFESNQFADRYRRDEININYIIRAFNLKYVKKYSIKPIEENSKILVVDLKNSNNEIVNKEFDYGKFEKELIEAKSQWYNRFQCKKSKTIAKWKGLIKKSDKEITEKMAEIFSLEFVNNYGINNFREIFGISSKYTNKIISLLLEYIKWNYKIENKKFDVITLEDLGLECCNFCKKKRITNGN